MTLTQLLSSNAPYAVMPLHRTRSYMLSQGFGHYNDLYGRGFHAGVDIPYPEATILYSPVRGRVVIAQWQDDKDHSQGYGLYVGIQSDYWGGFRIFACHNRELLVKPGQNVDWDTPIAVSGNTGNSYGAHSHLQYQAEDTWDGRAACAPFYHKLIGRIWLPTTYDTRDQIEAPVVK